MVAAPSSQTSERVPTMRILRTPLGKIPIDVWMEQFGWTMLVRVMAAADTPEGCPNYIYEAHIIELLLDGAPEQPRSDFESSEIAAVDNYIERIQGRIFLPYPKLHPKMRLAVPELERCGSCADGTLAPSEHLCGVSVDALRFNEHKP